MGAFWQHIPEHLDPLALSVGFFSLRWYALCFLGGWAGALLFSLGRERRGEAGILTRALLFDLFVWLLAGALVGARLGYALIYAPAYFAAHPVALFLPYDFTARVWTGLAGMSFHGGIVGVILTLGWFVRTRRLPFWPTADFIALAAPIVSFCGRIGNFLNLELVGRITDKPWGMYFPDALSGNVLRYPSQLIEAALEGVLLFVILWLCRKRIRVPGGLATLYLGGYGAMRFVSEFFREPDPQFGLVGGVLSVGQLLSLALVALSAALWLWLAGKKRGILFR